MKNFTTLTGMGYYKDGDGQIIGKYHFGVGEHPIPIDITAFDVGSEEELNAVEVISRVKPSTPEFQLKKKVEQKSREMAIDALQASGDITKKQADDLKKDGG